MVVVAAAAVAELLPLVDAAGAPEELLLPLELQAARSATAAVTAIAVIVVVAREGLVAREGPTPERLPNLMGTSWWRCPGPRRALVRAAEGVPGVPCARKIDRMYVRCQCP